MRRISQEKVDAIRAAADALVADGNASPTNDEVRAQLGGGSIADISPVMRQWREDQKHQASLRLQIPPGIAQAGERFVAQLWSTADTEAGKALDTLRAEHADQLQVLAAERDEALAEVARLEALANQLETDGAREAQRAADCQARLDACTQDNQRLALERERAVTQAQAAQENQVQLLAQLKGAQNDFKDLQQELLSLARTGKSPRPKK